MTEGLTFRGKLTLEDVLDMQHYRALAALRRPVRLLIGLVAMPIALLAAHDLYSHGLVALPDPEGEKHGLLRVIDEDGEDYLHHRDYFVPIAVGSSAARAIAVAS